MRQEELCEPVETVYLGGGTPSQLTMEQLVKLLEALQVKDAKEVTVECNPDDISVAGATLMVRHGVNRVSLGVQTLDDDRLRFLHRRHTATQVLAAVTALREAGVANISVDLMYGFPNQTLSDWQRDIDAVLALGVEHVSAYCLMVEEGTALSEQLKRGEITLPDEETERQMYETLMDRMTDAGYEHYEISNFAKLKAPLESENSEETDALPRASWRSLHNSNYWRAVPYIGLGAAAHSYDLRSRSWNVSDIGHYMAAIGRGELPSEREVLDDDVSYNDCVTVSLRTREGINLELLDERHRRYCLRESRRFLDDGLLNMADGHLALTRRGLFVSDMVMASLVIV